MTHSHAAMKLPCLCRVQPASDYEEDASQEDVPASEQVTGWYKTGKMRYANIVGSNDNDS